MNCPFGSHIKNFKKVLSLSTVAWTDKMDSAHTRCDKLCIKDKKVLVTPTPPPSKKKYK